MNFTDPIPFKCAEYSNSGHYLAIAKGNELTIFDSDNFTREQHFIFPETVTAVEWSPDDNFIFALLGKIHEVHLRCFNSKIVENHQEGWCATIYDRLGGIEAATWSPDSRQIITFSSNNLRVSIWSLIT
jgi:WD40 repeat protein